MKVIPWKLVREKMLMSVRRCSKDAFHRRWRTYDTPLPYMANNQRVIDLLEYRLSKAVKT